MGCDVNAANIFNIHKAKSDSYLYGMTDDGVICGVMPPPSSLVPRPLSFFCVGVEHTKQKAVWARDYPHSIIVATGNFLLVGLG